jgi:hypothetical protein
MPRKPDPNPPASRKKFLRIQRFLPCFFDVPAKDVHAILNVSHHTLDPIRRTLNLGSWPYNEVIRDKFCMTREEIEQLREQMMTLADDDMKITLRMMASRASECKAMLKPAKTKPQKFKRPKPEELAKLVENAIPSDELPVSNEGLPATSEQSWNLLDETNGEGEFWEEISRIFEAAEHASLPSEPCDF